MRREAVTGSGIVSAPTTLLIPAGQHSAGLSLVGRSPGPVILTVAAPRRSPASAAFTVLPPVTISGLEPPSGAAGSPVTILGDNFDPLAANNEVRFNGERALVAAATRTRLQVVVPVRAGSGPVSVTTPQGCTGQKGQSEFANLPRLPLAGSCCDDALPGEQVEMWYYDESATPDPASNQWRVMGTATISADGRSAVSDPGVGIPKFCCGATFFRRLVDAVVKAFTGASGGDGGSTGKTLTCPVEARKQPGIAQPVSANPVDLASGNNLPFEHRGFGIKSLVPVNIDCQYRSTDPRIGPFGRGTSFAYDWSAGAVGNAVIVATPDGVKYTLAREADGVYRAGSGKAGALGWEVRATASGRTLRLPRGAELDFNVAGNLVALRDAEGRTVRLTLDGNGFPATITDASGHGYAITSTTVTINRVIYRLITGVTDALGRSVGYGYDANARLLSHTDAGGNVTRYEYDAGSRVSKRIRPDGGTIVFEYDAAGRTTKETLEDGTSTIGYAYTTVGNLVTGTTVTDPRGNRTDYRFNGQGYVTRITDALGRTTTQTLDPATNLVRAITDPAGRTTRYDYDAKGNATAVTDALGQVTRIAYDPVWNKPTRITDALGQVATVRYDDKGRPVERTDPLLAVRRTGYNLRGLPETITDPLGRSVTLAYDDEGNLSAATDPLGNISRRRYDTANRLVESSNPLGHSASLAYDGLDRVTQATDANGGISEFAYDALDRLTRLTDPRGNPVERRTYDLRGRLTQRLDAANLATGYEYDASGNVTQVTDRKGQATTIAYDALNRPVEVTDADGRITRTEYDLAGNVAAIRDNRSGDLLFAYDLLDRPVRVISDQGSVEYQYDALGRRTKRTINGGDPTDYAYDANGRLVRIDCRGKSTSYEYDLAGRLLKKTLPNGIVQAYEFDAADRVTAIRYLRPDGSLLDTIGYAYDPAGRRTVRSAPMSGIAETPLTASYDASNRLTTLTLNGASYTLAYDANGNLTTKTAANGDTTTYTWDAQNRLVGIDAIAASGQPLVAGFAYDAIGRRIERTINGDSVAYLYDGLQAIAEIRGSAIDATLLTGLGIDEAIARYSTLGERSLLTDALGSVVVSTAENGGVQTAYGYSPYGQTESLGVEERSGTQYTGRENDGTGIYYYRARYYDPVLKRFLSEDQIGIDGGINTYSYVGGNPINYFDPDGHAKIKIDGNVIEVHPTDVDNWPSNPHGHIENTRNKIDKDGNIFDKTTKKQVGQLSKKSKAVWTKWLRGKGLLSVCLGALLIPDYSPTDALADLVGAGDAGEQE